MKQKMNRVETEAKINARAWKDPHFKKLLHSDPHAALREMGMENVPASLKIRVVEEEKNAWCIVIHPSPENSGKLSDKELEKMAAAKQSTNWGACV